jgi:hypothetical protein
VAKKEDLETWVHAALRAYGGSAKLLEVSKHIWRHHQAELSESGDLFFTWQYDMRWAANRLRSKGTMKVVSASPKGVWELSKNT